MRTFAALLLGSAWLAAPLRADEPPAAPPAPPAQPATGAPTLPADVAEALKGLGSEDRDARIAAAGAARGLQHEALLAALLKALKDDYRTVREAATQALATREEKGAKAKSAKALEARLKDCETKPDGAQELKVVVAALHDLAQASSIDPLVRGIEPTTDVEVARQRLRAVANVPSIDAVDALIRYAAKGHRGDGAYRGVALQALEYATGTKLGSLDAWHQWWADNKKTFDVEAAARRRAEQRAEADDKRQKKEDAKEKRREKKEGARGEGGEDGEKEGGKPEGEPKEGDPKPPPEDPKQKPQG